MSSVLAEILNALSNEKIAIIWLDTGAIDPSNPLYRAIHCYFIFQDDPLLSFSIWDKPGAEFYDDVYIMNKIFETIGRVGIAMHIIPHS